MKRLFLLLSVAALLGAAGVASAQTIGIGAGYVNSVNRTVPDGATLNTVGFDGFYLGVTYGLPIGNGLSLEPGFQYEFLTKSRNILPLVKENDTDHYIDIPVHLNYSLPVNEMMKFFVTAGPTFAIGLASQSKFSALGYSAVYDNYLGEVDADFLGSGIMEYIAQLSPYVSEYFNRGNGYSRFDVLLGIGAGIDLSEIFRFKVGYDWGLLNRYSNDTGATRHRNRLTVGVAYLF